MKGAIAEPLVSTIRPPKTTIMIMIGNSQNFLRARMNAQSSTMMEPMNSVLSRSELVAHRLRLRRGRSRNRCATNSDLERTEFMGSIIVELWAFMRARKKFWLLPIMIMMVVFGGLIVLTKGSAIAPFIYTLF